MQPETRTLWVSFLIVAMTLGCQATGTVEDDDVGSDDDVGDDDTADDDTATDDDTGGDDDSAPPSNFALSFHEEENRALTEETTAVDLGEEFTVEFWFQRTGEMQSYLMDSRRAYALNDGNWAIYQVDSEMVSLTFFFVSEEGDKKLRGPDINDLGMGWHHLAIVCTGVGAYMYIDGMLEAYEEAAPIVWDLPAPLAVGHRHEGYPGGLEEGILDEVRLSTVARYNAAFAPEPVLQADGDTALLWHLDEGVGDVATDEVIGLDLALAGVQWVEAER